MVVSDAMVSVAGFKSSVSRSDPPPGLSPSLQALWWAAKGNWDRAHKIVQEHPSSEAAWVHAYLHRAEGDFSNAQYWYQQATRPVGKGPLEAEWAQIAAALIANPAGA